MFLHVSKSGQTLGNISEKHRETSSVSEFARKHFYFSGSKFCFRNNVSTGGQTGKHLRKHRESQMFPQQCFLVCPGMSSVPPGSPVLFSCIWFDASTFFFLKFQIIPITMIMTMMMKGLAVQAVA
jgi:hypothetical protein